MLRQQTWGNRLYFSSFSIPVLEDPTYVGPEGIPRVLGAEGAAASARKIPSWRWGALPRVGPGQTCPLPPPHPFRWGRGRVGQCIRLWLGREFCRSFSVSPGGSPRSELYVSKDLGVTLGKTSWRGQLLNGIMKDKEISDIDLSFN